MSHSFAVKQASDLPIPARLALIVMLAVGLSLPLVPAPTVRAAAVLYVTPGGSGDCSTWVNACTLQTALGVAVSGDEFWVEVYVDPHPAPSAVNDLWYDLCDQGMFWGVVSPALPLAPGEAITLTYGDAYYWPPVSRFDEALPAGTPVYAQVDAYNAATTYGAVQESHEILGGEYNNVAGPVYSTGAASRRGQPGVEIRATGQP